MSSRSSCSEIVQRGADLGGVEQPPGAAGVDQDAGQRDQAGEPLGADGGVGPVAVRPRRHRGSAAAAAGVRLAVTRGSSPPAGAASASAICGSPRWRSISSATRSRSSLDQLGGADDAGVLAQAEHPGDELAGVGVRGDEQPIAGSASSPAVGSRRSGRNGARSARRSAADPDLGGPDRLAELPVDPVGVGAGVEVVGTLEVVLGLGGVSDLAADAGEPEHSDRVALVRAADHVELAALVEQLVGIDPPRPDVVALHRVVVEQDRLAAEDRSLDLGQALGDVVAAGRAGDPERDRALLRRGERARAGPRRSAGARGAAARRRRTRRRAAAGRSGAPPAPCR